MQASTQPSTFISIYSLNYSQILRWFPQKYKSISLSALFLHFICVSIVIRITSALRSMIMISMRTCRSQQASTSKAKHNTAQVTLNTFIFFILNISHPTLMTLGNSILILLRLRIGTLNSRGQHFNSLIHIIEIELRIYIQSTNLQPILDTFLNYFPTRS